MIPGEYIVDDGDIELNAGRKTLKIVVSNSGDRPIQVGSHYHLYETNSALKFQRDVSRGFRLNIPAGTAVRFEPGQQLAAIGSAPCPRSVVTARIMPDPQFARPAPSSAGVQLSRQSARLSTAAKATQAA